MGFNEDLRTGINAEELILHIIKKKYPAAHRMEGKFSEWDIFIPETGCSVEVKFDPRSCDTGNYLIEVSYGGKPSALIATKADIWAIYDGIEILWIPPIDVMRCLLYNGVPVRKMQPGDDLRDKRAYLIRKDLLRRWAQSRTKNITTNE